MLSFKYPNFLCRKMIVEMDQKEGLIRLTNPKGECMYDPYMCHHLHESSPLVALPSLYMYCFHQMFVIVSF